MKIVENLFGNRLIRHAENGNTDGVERVLSKRGISVSSKANARHKTSGNTALHQACLNGHVCTAKLLLEKGAKVNANNKKGETPLMSACRNRHLEIATLLLKEYYEKNEMGASINERNNAGWTALHYAASFLARNKKDTTCIDMCYLLLKYGALINGTANNGNTPLHFAGKCVVIKKRQTNDESSSSSGCCSLFVRLLPFSEKRAIEKSLRLIVIFPRSDPLLSVVLTLLLLQQRTRVTFVWSRP
jgi:Ankyrin repeats (3 copies)/Ankyrin repeat